jgi:hypothetical protein
MDITTNHFKLIVQGFTCCHAVAEVLHCHSTLHQWNYKQAHYLQGKQLPPLKMQQRLVKSYCATVDLPSVTAPMWTVFRQ